MNTSVLNLQDTSSVEEISAHVHSYTSMTIGEMVFINSLLEKLTNKESNLLKVINSLRENETNISNKKELTKIYNCFELYKDIMDAPY